MQAALIRDEPTSCWRPWFALAGLGYLAFVVYGSLVPLNFKSMPLGEALDAFRALLSAGVGVYSRTDWVANVLLTVPLSFLWTGACWPVLQAGWRIPAVIAVLAGCLAVSVTVEFLQLYVPARTASARDIYAQTLGAGIGISVWLFAGMRFARWAASLPQVRGRNDLAQRALVAYLFLMLGYNLLPLDLTLSPVEIYNKWRAGRVLIVPFGWSFDSRAQQFYELVSDTAIWAPVAFLWRLSSRKQDFPVWTSVVATAALIEFLQLFVVSRISDSTDVVLAALGPRRVSGSRV